MTCRVYDDLEAMLETEDLDAVIIATPPFFHRHYTELAMEAGLTAGDVAGTIHAHPTLPEALKEAMEAFEGRAIHSI